MRFTNNNTLQLDRELNELDKFVIKFIRILEKHTKYVIVSGYIPILLGRSRSTEDVDLFINQMERTEFQQLYSLLIKAGFWCLNGEDEKELYDYLQEGLSIRFARKGDTVPNMEVKQALKLSSQTAFNNTITVQTEKGDIIISSLERQIAYKRYYLKSPKDMEDASYIENLCKDHIDHQKIKEMRKHIETS